MKTSSIIFILLLIVVVRVRSQGQNLPPAPADKAVVYFARTSTSALLITFDVFDSAKLIGSLPFRQYFRYECEPGTHVFWARSENRDFINADLHAGKIYFVDTYPQMGLLTAGVRMLPLDGKLPKKTKGILKLIAKKPAENPSEQELATQQDNFKDVIRRGLEKYAEEKAKHKKNAQLLPGMNYGN